MERETRSPRKPSYPVSSSPGPARPGGRDLGRGGALPVPSSPSRAPTARTHVSGHQYGCGIYEFAAPRHPAAHSRPSPGRAWLLQVTGSADSRGPGSHRSGRSWAPHAHPPPSPRAGREKEDPEKFGTPPLPPPSRPPDCPGRLKTQNRNPVLLLSSAPWAGYSTSLSLGFFTYKVKVMMFTVKESLFVKQWDREKANPQAEQPNLTCLKITEDPKELLYMWVLILILTN
nr:uncharacterized protein LOC123478402 [Desmodus rotundus]